jgi:hypothetical protein
MKGYSHNMLTQKRALKSSSLRDWKRAKGSLPEKRSTTNKKERIAYSRLQVTMQKGEMKVDDSDDDEQEPVMLIKGPCNSVSGY